MSVPFRCPSCGDLMRPVKALDRRAVLRVVFWHCAPCAQTVEET